LFEVVNERGIDPGTQLLVIDERLAHDRTLGFGDEFLLLRIAVTAPRFVNENQPVFRFGGRLVVFPLCRRNPGSILETIAVAQNTDVNIAMPDLRQVRLLHREVGGGQLLEQERVEEFTQQRILPDVIAQPSPLSCELALNTAYEYLNRLHREQR
jgi:hypothetical protein